ncbi:MAG: iron donor protein CyaY [Myxococcales bacterium]|nr:iron donor protein CyaY [Myxococcales bacterium]
MMDEATFRQDVARVIRDLGRQLDGVDTDAMDWKLTEGVLTVEFDGGGVFVLSQQVPTRELWLSAFSRAWHFDRREGAWLERDTRARMDAVFSELFTRRLGFAVTMGL